MLVKRQRPPSFYSEAFVFCIESGTVLSFRDLVVRVLLPQWVLTSVFGMGPGGSPTP